ncbi:MAG: diaminopropionate ammonia-lyase [Eubacteriales bacterium]|nr:diaminopropionate ammonia-lyase [Eubacteriales bacterium]
MEYVVRNNCEIKNYGLAADYGVKKAKVVKGFHGTIPGYKPTPLVCLEHLAETLGISKLYVKDESKRFTENAFKVLGGSFALAMYLSKLINPDCEKPYALDYLKKAKEEGILPELTFITTTDGNHGRGVAWASRELGHKCVVYMPKGTALERLNNILALGADASITDLSYDDAVRLATENARKNGWVLVQDTSFENYEDIPKTIMQGYTTFALEITEQLNGVIPTHVFLQAGVGSMAGAITGFLADFYRENCPKIVIVEPLKADCIYKTAKADDGRLHFYTDTMDTMMAGLACGEPCELGWKQLNNFAYAFFSVEEDVTVKGMQRLGRPVGDDERIISGESGAVTTGLVIELMTNPDLEDVRKDLQLDEESVVVCISTEGATDSKNYERILKLAE